MFEKISTLVAFGLAMAQAVLFVAAPFLFVGMLLWAIFG